MTNGSQWKTTGVNINPAVTHGTLVLGHQRYWRNSQSTFAPNAFLLQRPAPNIPLPYLHGLIWPCSLYCSLSAANLGQNLRAKLARLLITVLELAHRTCLSPWRTRCARFPWQGNHGWRLNTQNPSISQLCSSDATIFFNGVRILDDALFTAYSSLRGCWKPNNVTIAKYYIYKAYL